MNRFLSTCAGAVALVTALAALPPTGAACTAHGHLISDTAPDVDGLDPWVRSAPPNVKAHAAYVTLMNHSTEAREVMGVTSPLYSRSEIHVSKVVDGIATMQRVSQVKVPPQGTIQLKPGGLHLMLMGPLQPITKTTKVPISLLLDDGTIVNLTAQVRAGGGGAPDHSGHHGGDHGSGHGTHKTHSH